MKKAVKQLKRFEDGMNQLVGRYAVYPKSCGDMIPIADCILFIEESKAQWHCILNPDCKYVKIQG